MNTDELSTGGGSPSAKSKKREGEKRTSPLTPLREKGKGKKKGCYIGKAEFKGEDMKMYPFFGTAATPSVQAAVP